jgi:hypothetical protein
VDKEAVGSRLNFTEVCGVVRSGQAALAANRRLEICPESRFEGLSIDAGDGGTLTKMKEGAGHAMQEDDADSERQERDIRNTKMKP